MGFVTVGNAGLNHYDRALRPNRGRPIQILDTLVEFLNGGETTIEIDELVERLNKNYNFDWDKSNLSPYLNSGNDVRDLRSAGAVNKMKAFDDSSRKPLQVHEGIVRTLSPGYYKNAMADIIVNIKRYLGAVAEEGGDTDPRAAWLYARLREWTEKVEEDRDPEVDIDIRQFGRPEEDRGWVDDFAFGKPPLLLGDFSKQFVEFAILIDIDYRNLRVTNESQLREALSAEIMDYYAAALHGPYNSFIGAVSSSDRRKHLQEAKKASNPEDPGHVNTRMPFFDWEINPGSDDNRIRISSLYQHEKIDA